MPFRSRRKAVMVTVVALLAGLLGSGASGGAGAVSRDALGSARAEVAALRAIVARGTVTSALDALLVERGMESSTRVGSSATTFTEAIGELADAVASAPRDGSAFIAAARITAAIDRALPALKRAAVHMRARAGPS